MNWGASAVRFGFFGFLFFPIVCSGSTFGLPRPRVCSAAGRCLTTEHERALVAKRNVKDGLHPGLEIHKATYRLGPHASEGSVGLSAKPTDLI